MGGPLLALTILFAALADAAFALATGCMLADGWLGADSGAHPGLRRTFRASLAALILCHLVRPWFVAASMSGSGGFLQNLALVPDILTGTHQGPVWYLNSCGLAALVAGALFADRAGGVARWAAAGGLLLVASAKAASGHAASDGDFSMLEFSMLLHFGAIAVWAGTVIASGLLVLPGLTRISSADRVWSYAGRLSQTVTWALAAILLSGVYISFRELNGAVSGLWTSSWGRVLMTKGALVAVAMAMGAASRFRCVQRPATGERAALLARLVRTEAFVMILILCVSGILANTPPAMEGSR